MQSPPEPFGLRPLARASLEFLLVVAAAAVVVLALMRLRLVVLPVVLALFAAVALYPVKRGLRSAGLPNALAALVTVATALAVVAAVLLVIVPPFVDEVGDVGDSARQGIDEITEWLQDEPVNANRDEIDRAVDDALATIEDNAGGIGRGVLSGATLALEVVAGALVALVLTFFFLADGARMWAWLLSLVPSRHRAAVDGFGNDVLGALGGYLRGVIVVAFVDATLIGIGLALLGIPLVIPLTVLTFLAAFIPLAGAFTAGAVAALVALVSNGVVDAVLVVVLVTAVQQVEGDLLYPLVVGRAIRLHPVAVLLSVVTGGVLYGIVGAALGVPVAAVVWAGIRRMRRQEVVGGTPAEPLLAQET